MSTTAAALEKLRRAHPEWNSWLSVIEVVFDECGSPRWHAVVPQTRSGAAREPRLAGITVELETELVADWLSRLFRAAVASGAPHLAALKPMTSGVRDVIGVFQASLCRDDQHWQRLSAERAVNAAALNAVAELLPMPFLQACGQRWAGLAEAWTQGFCPICAAWPAFAEVRGIERSRYLRCGRCGADWQINWLQCPYCSMTDHGQLATLVAENGDRTRTVEVCQGCLGYLKSFTVLQPSAPAVVFLDDLASADLDIAAVEQGYKRASGLGHPLRTDVVGKQTTKRRLGLWIR